MSILPFSLKEVEVNENWKPELNQEYLVQYSWSDRKDGSNHRKEDRYIIGKFNTTSFGYTFHWFWSASSLQLSVKGKSALLYPDDYKRFKRVWEFYRLTKDEIADKEEVEEMLKEFEI